MAENKYITDAIIRNKIIEYQKDEMMGYLVYSKLSGYEKNPVNKKTLENIANEEYDHFRILSSYTGTVPNAPRAKVWFYILVARIFGLTFGIKLLELKEEESITIYKSYDAAIYPEMADIAVQEEEHENKLIAMVETKSLDFISAIVLGMNDALVELTGSLAGFTLALQNSAIIALMGSITGIAAAMSMAASEYLSVKAEKGTKKALEAATYTGISYIITVVILIIPFLFIRHSLVAMMITLVIAVLIIATFNFYYSVVKGESFRKRFAEMLVISFTVVIISFGIGYLLKKFTAIDG